MPLSRSLLEVAGPTDKKLCGRSSKSKKDFKISSPYEAAAWLVKIKFEYE